MKKDMSGELQKRRKSLQIFEHLLISLANIDLGDL